MTPSIEQTAAKVVNEFDGLSGQTLSTGLVTKLEERIEQALHLHVDPLTASLKDWQGRATHAEARFTQVENEKLALNATIAEKDKEIAALRTETVKSHQQIVSLTGERNEAWNNERNAKSKLEASEKAAAFLGAEFLGSQLIKFEGCDHYAITPETVDSFLEGSAGRDYRHKSELEATQARVKVLEGAIRVVLNTHTDTTQSGWMETFLTAVRDNIGKLEQALSAKEQS